MTPIARAGHASSAAARLAARLGQGLLIVWATATLAFVLMRLAPGDPYASRLEGLPLSGELRAEWRAARGLDAPVPVQYVRYLQRLATGDLGWSTYYQRPVADVLRTVVPRTVGLMTLALTTSLLLGMLIGAWQGTRADSAGDQATSSLSILLFSIPEFWLALLLLQLFALGLGWLPATGLTSASYEYMPLGEQLYDRLRHLVLPWLTLSIIGTAAFARYQRAAMREAWLEPFVRTARAKGLPEWHVRRHAWRNALLPVITVLGLFIPALLGGAVFVERIFSWPGMGYATVQGVESRDYEFVTAAVIVGSAMTVLGNLLADGLQQLADPRLRT